MHRRQEQKRMSERQIQELIHVTASQYLRENGYKKAMTSCSVYWASKNGEVHVIKPRVSRFEYQFHRRMRNEYLHSVVRQPFSPLGIAQRCDVYKNRTMLIFPDFGLTLESFRHHHSVSNSQFLQWMQQIVEGLLLLQSYKMIHSDVKPSNICVTPKQARLIDFGHSLSYDVQVTNQPHVRDYPYFSPELMDGKTMIDDRHDVYSLGVTILRSLSNFNITTRADIAVAMKILKKKIKRGKDQTWFSQWFHLIEKMISFFDDRLHLDSVRKQMSLIKCL